MSTTDLKSYLPGSWFGIFGEHATVLLPSSEKHRVAALWELVDDGAGFDEVLDALIASGLRDLPAFMLVSDSDGVTKVVLRGAARAEFATADGDVQLDGSTASTWVERTLTQVTAMRVVLEEVEESSGALTIGAGLVRVGRVDEPPAPEAGRGDEREVLAVDEMDARQVEPAVTAEPAEDLGEGPTEELEEWSAATLEEPAATSEAAEDVATWAGVAPLPIPEHDPLNDPLVVQPSAAEERPVPTSAASALDEQPAAEPAHEEQYEEQSTHEQRPAAEESDLPTEVFHVPSEWEQPEEPAHEQPVEPAWGQHAAQEPVWGQHAAREPVGTHEPLAPEPVWGQPQPPEESVWGQPLSAEVPQWGEPGPEQATSVTARPVARLQFAHGDVVDVDCAILIGRAPEARRFSSTDQPRLVTVPSPNQEISSTHLEVRPGAGVDHGTAVVTDMGSTNGTVLVQPGGGPEDLEPGVPVPLVPGAIIDLGDGMTIQVLHA